MKRQALSLAMATMTAILVVPGGLAGASNHSQIVFSHVTVTAAPARGSSAVVMSIANDTAGPISLMTITSSWSKMNMIYYDDNMCQGNTLMTWLPGVFISSNATQLLGYRYQGAMLGQLTQSLKVGQYISLNVKYSNFSNARVITLRALVVAPPKGLHFLMSPMRM
jgi:copper(I)-binding protein